MILLLGLQSINVARGHKIAAMITSLLLGVCGFYVTGLLSAAFSGGLLSTVALCYLVAGPLGIVSSMYLHEIVLKYIRRK